MPKRYYFTSESVSEGHPDKVCDRISDSILDAFLVNEPEARVAVETLVTKDLVVVAGEVRATKTPDYDTVIRNAIREIGYVGKDNSDFNADTVEIINRIHSQSAEIAQGVDEGSEKEEGAGDQGLMFGYASNDTEDLMPAPIYYAHKLIRRMAEKRKNGEKRLGPDAKSQVTFVYEDGKPVAVDTILISHQHMDGVTQADVKSIVLETIDEVIPAKFNPREAQIFVNPTGSFNYGGPGADTGLTGRKIIVDTYGGMSRHGGGAFSGKDPTKVDRSAAYMARYLAKNIVAAGFADCCEIQLCYAIGVAEPLAIYLDTFDTMKAGLSHDELIKAIRETVSLTPKGIRTHLDLNRPIYTQSSSYGHFGRTPTEAGHFSWERTDLAEKLKAAVKVAA